MNVRLWIGAAVSALVWSATAAGQTPAPAVPSTPMPAVPPHQCVKPAIPGATATSLRVKAFNTEFNAYAECIKKYVADTKALINTTAAAGNAAVEEFNKFAADVKAEMEK